MAQAKGHPAGGDHRGGVAGVRRSRLRGGEAGRHRPAGRRRQGLDLPLLRDQGGSVPGGGARGDRSQHGGRPRRDGGLRRAVGRPGAAPPGRGGRRAEPALDRRPRAHGDRRVAQLPGHRAHLARRGGLAGDRHGEPGDRPRPGPRRGARGRPAALRLLPGGAADHGHAVPRRVRRGGRRSARSRPPGRAARPHRSSWPARHAVT